MQQESSPHSHSDQTHVPTEHTQEEHTSTLPIHTFQDNVVRSFETTQTSHAQQKGSMKSANRLFFALTVVVIAAGIATGAGIQKTAK